MNGKLYIVATPIGNLEDITIRAINTLNQIDVIITEDTRTTLKLLNKYNIKKHLMSYHRHSNQNKTKKIIDKLLNGENLAIVSDAGTPCISDPGEEIVQECIKNNIEIISIPGACALISGLIISGLETSEFTFLGFLPLNKKNRKLKLEEIKNEKRTVILYESPYKLIVTLNDLEEILEIRKITLAREITKIHEEVIRGTCRELISKIEEPKGEYVIIIEKNTNIVEEDFYNLSLEQHYEHYEKQGIEKKEIIKRIAKDRKTTKNEIYKYFI